MLWEKKLYPQVVAELIHFNCFFLLHVHASRKNMVRLIAGLSPSKNAALNLFGVRSWKNNNKEMFWQRRHAVKEINNGGIFIFPWRVFERIYLVSLRTIIIQWILLLLIWFLSLAEVGLFVADWENHHKTSTFHVERTLQSRETCWNHFYLYKL